MRTPIHESNVEANLSGLGSEEFDREMPRLGVYLKNREITAQSSSSIPTLETVTNVAS